MDEHRRLASSVIKEHVDATGHTIDWKNVKILEREQHEMKRKIKEAIHIRILLRIKLKMYFSSPKAGFSAGEMLWSYESKDLQLALWNFLMDSQGQD